MSVECNRIKGFVVTMPYDVKFEEIEDLFGDEFDDIYFSCWSSKPNRAYLFTDHYNGNYLRICYAEKTGSPYDYCDDDEQYFKLGDKELTDDIYDQMNYIYKKIYNQDLDKTKIEYALWYQWS